MKKSWKLCLMTLILGAIMMIPLMSASADVVSSNEKAVPYYSDTTSGEIQGYMVVSKQEAGSPINGYYRISISGSSISMTFYVRASDLANTTPTAVPTAVPTLDPSATLRPDATPTPQVIDPVKDSEYAGTAISYTVPAGGLWLYDKVGGSPKMSVTAGTTLSLTKKESTDTWWSVYYKSAAYYVPDSLLESDTTSGTEAEKLAQKQAIRSVKLGSSVDLYTSYSSTGASGTKTANTLAASTWVNARYVNDNVYSTTLNGTTYYFTVVAGLITSSSSATVSGNDSVDLMTEIVIDFTDPTVFPNGVKLYTSKSTSATFYKITSYTVLYGVKVDSDWYKVKIQGDTEVLYLRATDADKAAVSQMADSSKADTSTFWVTVGTVNADICSSPSVNNGVVSAPTGEKLLAGTRVLASPYSADWYAIRYDLGKGAGEKTYYLYRPQLADSTSTTSVTGERVFISKGTLLYSKANTANKTQIELEGGYYSVQVIDNLWYSLTYNGSTYYVYRKTAAIATGGETVYTLEDGTVLYDTTGTAIQPPKTLSKGSYMLKNSSLGGFLLINYQGTDYLVAEADALGKEQQDAAKAPSELANTTDGSTYTVTIGTTPATYYKDSKCTQPAGTLGAGEVVTAKRYSSALYILTQNDYYLPVQYIASIKNGDDKNAVSNEDINSNISDVTKGQTDSTFKNTVLTYTIPQGGLWLYRSMNETTSALTLNAGTKITLNGIRMPAPDDDKEYPDWYTTWYGGQQYYVLKRSLYVGQSDLAVNSTTYALSITGQVELFTNTALTTSASPKLYLSGTTVNVRVGAKNANGVVTYYIYSHPNGKTYYFGNDQAEVSGNTIMAANMASNTDASLITKLVLASNARLYTKPDTSSSSISVPNGNTLYGVKYNDNWYQVVYNNATWYIRSNVQFAETEQIAISSGATSTTYTVVINAGGALAFKQPNTAQNNQTYTYAYPDPANQVTIPGGKTVYASQYSSGWYTTVLDNGDMVYFQNTAASNSTSNDAVRSYQIILTTQNCPKGISLYNIISDTAPAIRTAKLEVKEDSAGNPYDTPYTLRKVSTDWSSVIIGGTTYYVKNKDLPSSAMQDSTPIASTSIGRTYQIIVGGKLTSGGSVPVYNASTLTPKTSQQSPIPAGTKLNGTLMYVEKADTLNGSGLVYQIKYNGIAGYIDAAYVSGIASGDEALEADKADQDSSGTHQIGETRLYTLNAGLKIYTSKSTSGGYTTLSQTGIWSLYKGEANWFTVIMDDGARYILVTDITGGASSGDGIAVGESVLHTFLKDTGAYIAPSTDLLSTVTIPSGQTYTIKKVNDLWYELTYNGSKVYVKVSDVTLSGSGSGTGGTATTTDGVGIITPYILISPSSGTVNLRKSPSTGSGSSVLASIPKDTQVINNGYVKDSNGQLWYKTTFNGKDGYVVGTYVKPVGTVIIDDTTGGTTADPTQDIGKTLTVNSVDVNVRLGPGPKYTIHTRIAKGTAIVPIAAEVGSDGMYWYKFYSGTTAVWIRADYVNGGAISTGLTGSVAVKAGDTNMRVSASETSGLVAKLARDTIVTIVGTTYDSSDVLWYRVTYGGLTGYVRCDLLRPLTNTEASGLSTDQYTQLMSGSRGEAVRALQQALINGGYLAPGGADGIYGPKTTSAVKTFQAAKGLPATGIASPATQVALFTGSTTPSGSGTTSSLNWFATGYDLINLYKNISIYDINAGISWNAIYVNGKNHADVVPASAADAAKLKTYNITGSWVRRPVIVTMGGSKYAGSMYMESHGSTNPVSYFTGVVCLHFTGSMTHTNPTVDTGHQAAISEALLYGNTH